MVQKDTKAKKKRWFAIHASQEFGHQKIGESYVELPEQLQNKHLRVNLGFLMGDPKKQSYTVTFKVVEIKGETGVAELVGYALGPSAVKRLIRKGIGKIEDSFVVTTKDNQRFQIKPVFVTRYPTYASVRTALRKRTRELILEMFQQMEGKDVFIHIMSNKLQMDLKSQLRKIFPLAISEIRLFERL